MCSLVLADLIRDQQCIPALTLARYRDEALRELQAEKWPKHLRVIETVKKALEDEK
jgi:hypothetical protein